MQRNLVKIFFAAVFLGVGITVVIAHFPGVVSRVVSNVKTPGQYTSWVKKTARVSGIVAPHHDVVQDVRKAFFKKLSERGEDPETIILVSPNHFNQGDSLMQMTDQPLQTSQGAIAPALTLVKALDGLVALEPGGFVHEHGITALLPDIKRTYPDATILPLMLKRDIPAETLSVLNERLLDSCSNCLMIASVDFSHYQPTLLADLHDVVSFRALQNLDTEKLLRDAEVDSPESLALVSQWARLHGTPSFYLFGRTNTGYLDLQDERETTSHLFGWYEEGEQVVPERALTFTFAGDVMLARGVAHRYADDLGEVFSDLGNRFFWGTDVAVVNLEGGVGAQQQTLLDPEALSFVFNPEAPRVLAQNGVTTVSLANNHASNADIGVTRDALTTAGILWFGGPASQDQKAVQTVSAGAMVVTLIGVNTFAKADDIGPLIHTFKEQGHRVVVYPHWGDEYARVHTSAQESMAHHWIDSGADLIVGSHPHVIQDVAVYKGKPIIYSLGNFIFDQTFSKATQTGIVLSGTFTDTGVKLFLTPIEAIDLKPRVLRGQARHDLLDALYEPWKQYKLPTEGGDVYDFKQ